MVYSLQRMDTQLYTAEDLRVLDGDYELVRGVLVEMTPPTLRHGVLCARIAARLLDWSRRAGGLVACNDSGFILGRGPDTVRGPDVSWVRADRVEDIPEDGYLEGAPDLAVEVLSPSDRPGAVHAKIANYLEAGCPLVWVLDPRHSVVEVYTADRPVQVLRSGDVLELPGFAWPVAEIFD